MAPISDQHWHEIVEVNPGLQWVEDLVRDAGGERLVRLFRDDAVGRLRSGDQKYAAAGALDAVLRELPLDGEGE